MAKKHANQMCPTVEAFLMFVAVVFGYQLFKNIPVYQRQKLTKNVYIYHCCGDVFVISI